MKCLVILLALASSLEAYIFYGKDINDTDRDTIVNKHNELRILIATGQVPNQPRGINLKKMKWDDSIAAAAQKIADSCIFEHQAVSDDRWSVGQNLYMSMSSGYQVNSDWNGAIQAWFDEYKQFNYTIGLSSGTGHYTQVVWATSEYVGCGYTFFKDDETSYWYNKFYVCNYGPAGNYVGQKPYETDEKGCENLC